jgi:hypothetical protein
MEYIDGEDPGEPAAPHRASSPPTKPRSLRGSCAPPSPPRTLRVSSTVISNRPIS